MARERGTGSVYLPEDLTNPGQKLKTYWISYYIVCSNPRLSLTKLRLKPTRKSTVLTCSAGVPQRRRFEAQLR